jgi:uncharacterized membrane protein
MGGQRGPVRRVARALRWASRHRPAVALGCLVAAYIGVFGWLTWRHHANFGTAAFDMGIYDQGLWLLSRFREPFVTVRGLDYFGHHANYSTVLLVPAYWLGAGPQFLYLFETVVLALGAMPVWLLTRDRIGNRWAAVGLASAYLLHPAVQWMNWWHFHPDALMITPLLFAWWFATRERWGWFAVCAALVALTKEDGAMAVAALGGVLLLRRSWKPGMTALLAGAGWFLLATRVLIPRANGGLQPLYNELFPDYGSSMFEIVATMLRHPGRVIGDLTEHSRLLYFAQLFTPVAFAPALALPVVLIAVPQLLINSLSGHASTHDIHYHYSAVPVAAIFVATVEGIRRLPRERLRPWAVGAVVVASLVGQVAWGPSPIGRAFDDGYWFTPKSRAVATMAAATELVPPGVGVSATDSVMPHLTHRVRSFVWPHPFAVVPGNWGVEGSSPPDPDDVDYLVVDLGDPFTYEVLPQSQELFFSLTGPSGPFDVIFESDEGIFVAKRQVRSG